MPASQPAGDSIHITEKSALNLHSPGAPPTNGKADVGELRRPVAAYPNALPPNKHAHHVPQYGVPVSWGPHYGFLGPWPTNNLSGSSPGGLQKRKAPPYDPTCSAAEDMKNRDCSMPVQKCSDNVRDTLRPGHHLTHYGMNVGPAMMYPNTRLPNTDAHHIPQYGYPITQGGGLNGFVYPDPTSVLSGSFSGPQRRNNLAHNSPPSASNDKKDTGYGVPAQKHTDNTQDSISPGCYPVHTGTRFGPVMVYPNARPHYIPQYGYPTTWSGGLNGFANPDLDRTRPRSPAGRTQETTSPHDSAYRASGNKKALAPGMPVSWPQIGMSHQGLPIPDNARSMNMNPDDNLAKDLNPAGDRTAATGGEPKDTINDSVPKVNVVVFGETGVGRSSVINLIADEKRAHTSNGALECTFKHERHDITLGGVACTFWDTTGLDEGSEGTVPADVAEKNLRALLEELAHPEGIHLVIYCIRAARLTKILKRNYDLFYVGICRKKVPVALVMTDLEHEEGEMETWWHANKETLLQSGMRFDAHACVTTLDSEDRMIQNRRSESRRRLHDLVFQYSRLPPWRIARSTPSLACSAPCGDFRENGSTSMPENIKTVRKVIICDMTTNPRHLVHVSPGITALWQRFDGMINDKRYEFVRVDKHALEITFHREVDTGMVVFYTALIEDKIPQEDVTALQNFFDSVGGHICPVIVVLGGCNNEETARRLGNGITLHHSDVCGDPIFLPSMEDGQSELNETIEMLCIERMGLEVVEPAKAGKNFFQAVETQVSHITGLMTGTKQRNSCTPSLDGGGAEAGKTTEKIKQPTSSVGVPPDGGDVDEGKAVKNAKQVASSVRVLDDWEPGWGKSTETAKLVPNIREDGGGETTGGNAKQLADVQAPGDGEAMTWGVTADEWREILSTRQPRRTRGPHSLSPATDEAKCLASDVQTPDDGQATMWGITTDETMGTFAMRQPRRARSPGNPSLATGRAEHLIPAAPALDVSEATMGGFTTDEWRDIFATWQPLAPDHTLP